MGDFTIAFASAGDMGGSMVLVVAEAMGESESEVENLGGWSS